MTTIVILPLQDHLPSVAGFSISFLNFAVLALHVVLNRPKALSRVLLHPVFLASYSMIFLTGVIEYSHSNAAFSESIRMAAMVAGGVLLASLYRDKRALRWGLYGYLIAGIWLSCFIFLTSYGILHAATADTFEKASQIRAGAFKQSGLHVDLNGMAFIAGQGAVVALALALFTKVPSRRYLLWGIVVFCSVGVLLTMSRGGVVIVVIALASIALAHGVKHAKTIAVVLMLGVGIIILAPNVVFSRLTLSSEAQLNEKEIRAALYRAAFKHLDEYILGGVGIGNFRGTWGMQTEFSDRDAVGVVHIRGAHNVFVNMTIYWGLIGSLSAIVVFFQAYRCLPRHCGDDSLSLCLLGLSIIMFMISLVVETIILKDFSLGLGMLVGTRRWIWPKGVIRPMASRQRHTYPMQHRRSVAPLSMGSVGSE